MLVEISGFFFYFRSMRKKGRIWKGGDKMERGKNGKRGRCWKIKQATEKSGWLWCNFQQKVGMRMAIDDSEGIGSTAGRRER